MQSRMWNSGRWISFIVRIKISFIVNVSTETLPILRSSPNLDFRLAFQFSTILNIFPSPKTFQKRHRRQPQFKMINLFANTKRKRELGQKKEGTAAFRLPKNVVAKHYAVCFKPNIEELEFEASILMDANLVENTRTIVLNSIDLIMTKAIWEEDVTRNRQEPVDMKVLDKGQHELKFDPFLVPQKGQLRLNFNGMLNDKKHLGLYRSKNSPNDDFYTLIAQFEPTDARRCMPCMDDPASKAEFDVCLIIPKGQTVVGNMPIKARYNHKRNPELEIIEFKRTPPIPTYSLAFVVGQFEFVETRTADEEVLIRVYTAINKKHQGLFAMGVAAKAVTFLASYFSCTFPLQKLDIMAIPGFTLNSSESWGLVRCRESQLLLEEEHNVSSVDKQHVALVVCEEIVQQWIGNLVTYEWWNQLWVKEGLATFLRYVCMEDVKPDYETSTHFITEIVSRAMQIDALKSTHPLEQGVLSSLECEELFDEICYQKSAAIFRMLYNFVGEGNFKAGLVNYISKYAYKNASNNDLWKCWDEVSNKPVTTLMNNWTNQKGYPLVRVAGKHDGKNRFIKLTQEKFSIDPIGRDTRAEGTWVIPITVTSERDPTSVVFSTILDSRASTMVIPDTGKNEWIKINPGAVGFYRTRYSTDMFHSLVQGIRNRTVEPVDRLNILDDKFALMLSGVGATIEILTLLEAFMEDDDYNVWRMLSHICDKLMNIMSYMNLEDSLQHFGRYLYSHILERVGYKFLPNDSHQTKLLRSLVLLMMAKFNHQEVNARCKELFDEISIRDSDLGVPPDLRYCVYYWALIAGEDEVVKSCLRIYKETNSVSDRRRIANAFGAVSDPTIIKQLLEFSISDDVRKRNSIDIILALCKHKNGREVTWAFFKENFSLFKNRYGASLSSRLIQGIIEDFATEERAMEITEYFKTNQIPGTDKAVALGVENIFCNVGWIKREKNPSALKDYLDADAL